MNIAVAVDSVRRIDSLKGPASKGASVLKVANACSSCSLRALCLPCGVRNEDVSQLDGLVYSRRRVKRGEFLYRAGEPFAALYTFRTGFFKSSLPGEDGRTQVTGFQMPGEVLGLDGMEDDVHQQDVVALEDAEVCVIPYVQLAEAAGRLPALQRHLHRLMSREIVRDHGLMLLLGTMRADARVATFLLNLSKRFAARGFSSTEFNLRMTREEIGSYLGLKLETVSRVLSRFQERGLINAHQRYVQLLNVARLTAETFQA
jgi:CRP/FNR family transcriptional regulator, anaerobic regulatory protein